MRTVLCGTLLMANSLRCIFVGQSFAVRCGRHILRSTSLGWCIFVAQHIVTSRWHILCNTFFSAQSFVVRCWRYILYGTSLRQYRSLWRYFLVAHSLVHFLRGAVPCGTSLMARPVLCIHGASHPYGSPGTFFAVDYFWDSPLQYILGGIVVAVHPWGSTSSW